jgi:hypothetical protein
MHTTTAEQTAALPGRNTDRVRILIERFAALTEPGKGPGITCLAYSPLERRAHTEFTTYMEELGRQVSTDAAGNTIAELHYRTPVYLSSAQDRTWTVSPTAEPSTESQGSWRPSK